MINSVNQSDHIELYTFNASGAQHDEPVSHNGHRITQCNSDKHLQKASASEINKGVVDKDLEDRKVVLWICISLSLLLAICCAAVAALLAPYVFVASMILSAEAVMCFGVVVASAVGLHKMEPEADKIARKELAEFGK